LKSPQTPDGLRNQLRAVNSIRDFATRTLGLPDNGSYRTYADVGRPYVVWNVVAAPEFSVDPKEWCYPIVGCVAYRGYFDDRRASSFAAKLRARGLDVSVGGVAAYSTLGHFDDPILNTMMAWNDIELAAIVFHELTHQLMYLPGDAPFNEALATTVEEEGVRRWLVTQGRSAELHHRLEQQDRYLRVIELLRRTRVELEVLYASGIDTTQMRERKAAAFDRLKQEYRGLTAQWGGEAPFASWFGGQLNNARLASVATYYDCVPGFERELAAAGGDLTAFYGRVRQLARLDQHTRDSLLCRPSQEPQ
jgi:predicted aminopeptidase